MQNDLAALCREHPSLASALSTILDRCERRGRLPRSITLAPDPGLELALRAVFAGPAVKRATRGLRLDLSRAAAALPRSEPAADPEAELTARLYEAIGRAPHDPRRAALEERLALSRALSDQLAVSKHEASRRWLVLELDLLARGGGDLALAARARGLPVAERLARDVVRVMDAAVEADAPVRIQTFSAKVLGSSKALRPGSDLFKIASAALYELDPGTRELVHLQGEPSSRASARNQALEARGVYRDEVAASVLCFGPIVYRKGRERFDHVARHAALGESSRLVQHQLRDAVLERPAARRVTVFENLTPYLDYVDALVMREIANEIVVCSGGHATWAVVRLLELCAQHALPTRHASDLDRAGIYILRSLARRTGARVVPFCMGVSTHKRFVDRGQPITDAERAAVKQMLATDRADAPCHALLAEIARTGVWIEQEAFADDCLEQVLAA
jgi:hypothetical protein